MPTWIGLGFQDRGSPFMTQLSFLHDHIIIVILVVIVFIAYLITYLLLFKGFYKFFSEGTIVETIWSIIPSFLLIVLVLPSIQILYMIEDVKSPSYTFKVVAHQWYWTYVTPLLNNLSYYINGSNHSYHEFDSIIDLERDFPRLLGCSSSFSIPVDTISRFLISSTDVIHSFAIPSMALKVDAVPGRINQIFAFPVRCGVFFGQCSEICGSNHSFMPIVLKVRSLDSYNKLNLRVLLNDVIEVNKVL